MFKEDPANLAKSRQNLNKMYWVEKGLQVKADPLNKRGVFGLVWCEPDDHPFYQSSWCQISTAAWN